MNANDRNQRTHLEMEAPDPLLPGAAKPLLASGTRTSRELSSRRLASPAPFRPRGPFSWHETPRAPSGAFVRLRLPHRWNGMSATRSSRDVRHI